MLNRCEPLVVLVLVIVAATGDRALCQSTGKTSFSKET